MRYGVMFPGDEIDLTGDRLDEWIDAVSASGFDHIAAGDHVVGVDPESATPGWDKGWPSSAGGRPAFTVDDVFREPLTLLAHLAGKCDLDLVTGILILPQRQTVLVAKQAAEVDLLSGGRLRLGVGIGWNRNEYEALGVEFRRRGPKLDEQIELLRRLWTARAVDFTGDYHRLDAIGLTIRPVQQPIPIWVGGDAPAALTRAGRVADGLFLSGSPQPDTEFSASLDIMRRAAEQAGRDPESVGLEPRLVVGVHSDGDVRELADAWRRLGATHLCIDTRFAGTPTLAAHMEQLRRAEALLR